MDTSLKPELPEASELAADFDAFCRLFASPVRAELREEARQVQVQVVRERVEEVRREDEQELSGQERRALHRGARA